MFGVIGYDSNYFITVMPIPTLPETVAAVDLGSNSFHMVVARLDQNQLVIVDRLRSSVRLGAGLNADKSLDPVVRRGALDCLARFGQRLSGLPAGTVRAVGTNTMRQIQDGGDFLRAANQALGHEIEIISGQEEARLVYLGVAHGLAVSEGRRLVIDIGGGSTELVLGEGMSSAQCDSLYMGCVSLTRWVFADGVINAENMRRAMLRCALEVRPVKRHYRQDQWRTAVGSSGTIKSIGKVVRANGWCDEGISADSLAELRRALLEFGHISAIDLPGLTDERRPVFVGGVAVLSALFDALRIEHLHVSDAALREGLLYQLLGYIRHHDVRDQTVASLIQRFSIDRGQVQRVNGTAMELFDQIADVWGFGQDERKLLEWACCLHEIGLSLSHNGFHKHGAYIVRNADLPGFSRQQQARLAVLVRNHRRKFNRDCFDELPESIRLTMQRLCIPLRLAVLLHRGRSTNTKPTLSLKIEGNQIRVVMSGNDLLNYPLTRTELGCEVDYLAPAGLRLILPE